MSFFIRQKKVPKGKMKRKGIHNNISATKRKKKSNDHFNDEEILTDDEEIPHIEDHVDTDEDAHLTAQEKKVKLAKEYLKDIEKEERSRLETEELGNDVILGRLHEDVLSQAGKLKKRVANSIIKEYNKEDFHVLKCKEHKLSITCIAISTNNFLYSGSKDCAIVKWSLNDMKKVGIIPPKFKCKDNETLHGSPILCLAVSNDNKYLASGDSSNVIQVWDPDTLSHVYSFKGHTAAVTGLQFCRFTQHLYSASRDRTVRVWSVQERAYLETLFGHHMPITSLDVLAKDRVVTSGGTDNSVRVWKIQEESQLIYNYTRSIDGVRRLDDHHFVSYGEDGSVCMWVVTKKKPLHIIKQAHGLDSVCKEPRWISSVACISNSDVFVSGSCDGFVKLWKCDDNYRGSSLLGAIPIIGFVNDMAFTSDGENLVIGIGQEHKLGRWSRIKEAKNSIVVIKVKKPD